MNKLPSLNERVVRVVIRMGGRRADAADALGVTKETATKIARRIGLRFRESAA